MDAPRSRPVTALVVGDTHLTTATLDRMPDEVWHLAEEADVVLHTGDVTEPSVLESFARRATVHAVLGNNDRSLEATLPERVELDLAGVTIGMVHDSGPTAGRGSRLRRWFPGAGVVVFGHSHQPVLERSADDVLLVNPGSPTQRRRQPVHTVAWLELAEGTVRSATLIEVGPLAGLRQDRELANPLDGFGDRS